ncbi:GNAT family N-acetyltransferase [Kytococcus sp. Marseille-QA3725]
MTAAPDRSQSQPQPNSESQPHSDSNSEPQPPRGELRRDAAGIPWVLADSEPDLLHAQGWVTARDRAWQLVSDRWRAHGRWHHALTCLREVGTEVADQVVDGAAEWDSFAERIGVRATAERSWAALSPDTREWVEHFASGVRDGLASLEPSDVPEMSALAGVRNGASELDWCSWDATDCLAVFWLQQVLFGDWPHQLWRQHVTEQLGEEWVARLAADPSAQSAGSNAVGVAAVRSASGAPMLASDPHRLLEAPGVYQQVRLTLRVADADPAEGAAGHPTAPQGYYVAGLAFPGVPGVQHLGHTGSVAWCITNAMARTQQLVAWQPADDTEPADDTDSAGDARFTGGAESAADVEPAGGQDGTTPTPLWGTPGAPGARAVRQAADLAPGLGFEALPLLLRARTATDATDAWDHWVEPANCVLVADRTTVLEGVAGRPLDVVDQGSSSWSAHQPWREVDSLAVHANHRRDQTRSWGEAFAPSHRADRLTNLLAHGSGPGRTLTVDDLRAAQLDTRSDGLLALLQATGITVARGATGRTDPSGTDGLTGPADTTGPAGPDGTFTSTADALSADHPVARALAEFNGRMEPESDLALLAWRWRTALARRVADLPLLAPLYRDSSVTAAARAEFPTLLEPWLDVTARIGLGLESLATALPDEVGACARAALDDVELPTCAAPGNRWGAEHQAAGLHALGWPVPMGPVGGDVDCVAATSSIPGRTAVTVRGPVCRAVLDLADPASSRWAVPLGTDGRLTASTGRSQTEAWRTAELLPVFGGERLALLGEAAPPSEVPVPQPPELVFTPVVPATDGPTIHTWATQNRGRFWGMGDYTVEDVIEVYTWLDESPHHGAWMVTHAGQPVALWQTYDPAHDPVGESYEVLPGDLGMHLMIGPHRHGIPDLPMHVGLQALARVFEDPTVRRLVAEPDVRNAPAIARLVEGGFVLGDVVDLGHKVAQFAFLDRDRLGLHG